MQIVFAGICAGGAQKWAFLPQCPSAEQQVETPTIK